MTGVDADAAMVTEAERRAAEAGLADRVRHLAADAAALPFVQDVFDADRDDAFFASLNHLLVAGRKPM